MLLEKVGNYKMQSINLVSLIDIQKSTSPEIRNDYYQKMNIQLKDHEFECLSEMLSLFSKHSPISLFDSFFVNYTIKQIGKEFDLLRITEDLVLNIELKSELDEEKISKQIKRNFYYLKALNKKTCIFTYVLSTNCFYILNEDSETIESVEMNVILAKLNEQTSKFINPNSLFVPSNYLVSPFNRTDEFEQGNYFLTQHQEKIKNHILKERNNTLFCITGSAGTGKTLLVYDLAREFMLRNMKTMIIHGGYLNNGQKQLNKSGYVIEEISQVNNIQHIASSYDVIIIDEAQRISVAQFNNIYENCIKKKTTLILSYDQKQVLSKREEESNIGELFKQRTLKQFHFTLTKKIRTNKHLSNLIMALIDKKNNFSVPSKFINYTYFNSYENAIEFTKLLRKHNWTFINPTASKYNPEVYDRYYLSDSQNTHKVIGQEFDKVGLIIPPEFTYSLEGKLLFRSRSYYHAEKMFYQAISRTKNEIWFVIVKNDEILNRLLEISEIT